MKILTCFVFLFTVIVNPVLANTSHDDEGGGEEEVARSV